MKVLVLIFFYSTQICVKCSEQNHNDKEQSNTNRCLQNGLTIWWTPSWLYVNINWALWVSKRSAIWQSYNLALFRFSWYHVLDKLVTQHVQFPRNTQIHTFYMCCELLRIAPYLLHWHVYVLCRIKVVEKLTLPFQILNNLGMAKLNMQYMIRSMHCMCNL